MMSQGRQQKIRKKAEIQTELFFVSLDLSLLETLLQRAEFPFGQKQEFWDFATYKLYKKQYCIVDKSLFGHPWSTQRIKKNEQ